MPVRVLIQKVDLQVNTFDYQLEWEVYGKTFRSVAKTNARGKFAIFDNGLIGNLKVEGAEGGRGGAGTSEESD